MDNNKIRNIRLHLMLSVKERQQLQERMEEVAVKILEQHHKYRNFNLFISRGESFENAGRIHDLEASRRIDREIKQFLSQNNIYYGTYNHETVPIIVDNIQKHLEKAARPPQRSSSPAPRAPPKPFELPSPNRNADRVYAYLRGRGIGKELINRCIKEGLLYESAHARRCVFVGKDGAVAKFACEHSIRDDWKKDVTGSDKRFSFHLPPSDGKNDTLAVFEGPADVLAHHEVCRLKQSGWDGYRLSLGGTALLALTSFLERNPQITKLYLCLDNNEPGRNATKRIMEELVQDGRFSHLRMTPAPAGVGKNYADTLVVMQKQNIPQQNRHRADLLL